MRRAKRPAAKDIRPAVLLVTAFALSLAASLAYQMTRHEGLPEWLQQVAHTATGATRGDTGRAAGSSAGDRAAAANGTARAAGAGTVSPGAAVAAAPAPATDEQRELLSQALTAQDPQAREFAVGRLSESTSDETVYGLSQVASSDASPHVRIVAIDSLRVVAGNTLDPDGSIRAILLAAASDPNREVALNARMAYEEIEAAVAGSP